jgi:hypothetical protein
MEKPIEPRPPSTRPSPRTTARTVRSGPIRPQFHAKPTRSTGIDPKGRKPIDPRMPFLPPA